LITAQTTEQNRTEHIFI